MVYLLLHMGPYLIFLILLQSLKILALMRESLPHTVEPAHYDLYIYVEGDKFGGCVRIAAHANEPVSEFVLNAHKDLALSDVEVNGAKAEFTHKDDLVTVHQGVSGDFELSITFGGSFVEGAMEGFYRSHYKDTLLYSTHFEPTDARRAFPCFDQPDMKATFTVAIKPPAGYIALSNTASKLKDGIYKFEKTPLMSTYIVAFVIGKVSYIESTMHRKVREEDSDPENVKKRKEGSLSPNVPIRVYAHADEVEWGRFALDVATRCLMFFEEYFEVPYPLSKLDMVAIPAFAMGAMENWGLVTYRSSSLLFDPLTTALRSKKNIAITVCHELAHMWFGNLVTMAWWSDLWLNEGFATWAATLAIDRALKDILPFNAWAAFINDEEESGLAMDALRSTHRIGIEVEKPVEIDQIFDAISYSKGASLIRMIEGWLGAETFRAGLVRYLRSFSHRNATTHDLWNSLTDAQNKKDYDVAAVVDPWVSRPGFPYISITEKEDELVLEQHRFTLGHVVDDDPWPIPLRVRWDDASVTDHLMVGPSIAIPRKTKVYKINDGVSGFYRVLYPADALSELLKGKRPEISSAVNRMNLFSDAFSLALALRGPLPLRHLGNFANVDDYETLRAVLASLDGLSSIFYDIPDDLAYLKRVTLKIVGPLANEVSLTSVPENIDSVACSSLVIATAVRYEHAETIKRLKEFSFADVSQQKEKGTDDGLSPEFIRSFFSAIVDEHFMDLFELCRSINKAQSSVGLRQHALVALGATADEKNFRFLCKNFKEIASHETIYLFASLGSNLRFRNDLAMFFIEKYDAIGSHIANPGLMRHALEASLKNVFQDEYRQQALAFLKKTREQHSTMDSAVDKALDSIEWKMSFREKFKGIGKKEE